MTRFLFEMQILSRAKATWYTFDGECEGQCVVEARAVLQTLANTIIDQNPEYQFEGAVFVLRPWLKVVDHA